MALYHWYCWKQNVNSPNGDKNSLVLVNLTTADNGVSSTVPSSITLHNQDPSDVGI